jgi:hypothetical protein
MGIAVRNFAFEAENRCLMRWACLIALKQWWGGGFVSRVVAIVSAKLKG